MTVQTCSLYAVTAPDGRKYIGLAARPHDRWSNHRERSLNPTAKSQYLHQAMHKHGRDNFSFEVLFTETGNDARKKAEEAEQLLIELVGTIAPNGFNVSTGGTSGSAGHKRSKELKAINTAAFKKMWAENYEGQRLAVKAGSNKPESIERKRVAAKALWQNPSFVEKMMKARASGKKSGPKKFAPEQSGANAKGAAIQHQTF